MKEGMPSKLTELGNQTGNYYLSQSVGLVVCLEQQMNNAMVLK
jgi:hypothetical protein